MNDAPLNSATLSLSYEELVLLLTLLNLPSMPGLEANPINEFTNVEGAARLTAAQHGLQARGLMRIAPNALITLDQLMATILVNYAAARASITLVTTHVDSSPETRIYGIGQQLAVEYWLSQPGVHSFIPLTDMKDVAASILIGLGASIEQAAPSDSAFQVRADWLRLYQDTLAQSGVDAAANAVEAQGMPSDITAQLTTLYTALEASHLLVGLGSNGRDAPLSATLGILRSNGAFWLLLPRNEVEVQLIPADTLKVSHQVVILLKTILPELS